MRERDLIVREPVGHMCVVVDRQTGMPRRTAFYDPYCYTDPDPCADYIEMSEWLELTKRFKINAK